MTRSLPEKTFEHWCSMHLNYRYRAKMLMWWPSQDADIEAVMAPQTWGKRFWLELKTTEWKGGPKQQRHELSIDLDQLDRYGQNGIPDYYVFPVPEWQGILKPSPASPSSSWLAGIAPERLAYQSWSRKKWFAEWTFVVPGWALRKALHKEIRALPPVGDAKRKKPFHIATVKNGHFSWETGKLRSVPRLGWKEFWHKMDACGGLDWPAQFLLPPKAGPTRPTRRSDLMKQLQQLAEEHVDFNGQVQCFNPIGDDLYTAESDASDALPEFNWGEEARALVALNEHALTPRK